MVIIYCEMHIAPEKQAEYIARVNEAGIVEATNREPGCVSYELAASAGTPGKLYIVERWESPAALPTHMKGANYAALMKINAEYGLKGDAAVYTAEPLKMQ